ncbi:hypothetical protein CMO88_03940 [Candidatus Woesearchaeota archaeon]|nr:hypothetical protein [Candidatus Woesearchaeota archaeon]|tara:strand:- start:3199 stop:3540 length:342 start_codon:yes stop_codon:yes gene_type:complete
MNETSLVKLSLSLSFFGLFLLFVISLFVEAEEVKISELSNVEKNDVKISGQIIAIKKFDNLAIVEIAELKSVDVIVFDKKMLDFKVGNNIIVTGEVKDYKGKKEIIAERIRKE